MKTKGAYRLQSDVTKLNWTGLTRFTFYELTNGQAMRAYWSLVDAYVSLVT